MDRAGWGMAVLVLGLAAAARAQTLEGRVAKGSGQVEGTLAEGLAVSVSVELAAPRPLVAKDRRAAEDASLPRLPPPDQPVRLVKAFKVRIAGEEVPLTTSEFAGLRDLDRIRVSRDGRAVHCRLHGWDGPSGYEVTFTFVATTLRGTRWMQSSRSFFKTGAVRTETAETTETWKASAAEADGTEGRASRPKADGGQEGGSGAKPAP